MVKKKYLISLILFLALSTYAARFNAYGLKFHTTDSDHFRITYQDGCGHLVEKVKNKLEQLYSIYSNTYGLVLPSRTEIVILDSDYSNGWALSYTNTITLWTHDSDFKLRGSHDWWEDVITHEYAHIVSIWTGMKLTHTIPEIRLGYFSHTNEPNRIGALHSYSTDILPFWFTEGIAQYESSRHGSDTWDTHRDMVLRSLTLSGKLLSWDHMQVGTGKGDDYEKAYDHGFSLVKYIAEHYGYDKILALLRESTKINRLDFDNSIKEVLGKSGRKLYEEWKLDLEKKYKAQISTIGTQVYGKKINKDGFENYWPKFSPDDRKIFFISNGKHDYGFQLLYQYQMSDTVDEKKKITPVMGIDDVYDIHPQSGRICYQSAHSKKSMLPAKKGGYAVLDVFTDTLPADKKKFKPFHKTEKQITTRKSVFNSAFSPKGDMIACAQRVVDKFQLAIVDTTGKNFRIIYPAPGDTAKADVTYIYSIDWAPDGRHIAFCYMDNSDRKIAVYDTLNKKCDILCNTEHDERDPSYSWDGKYLYFSSDRTGIFNIYRFDFQKNSLEQCTNVSGGAFAPSVSHDGNKMVYTGYDKNGFGIYLIDSLKHSSTEIIAQPYSPIEKIRPRSDNSTGEIQSVNRMPTQVLIMPTLLAEQTITDSNNEFHGITTVKAGLIFNLLDPLTISDLGSELGGYALLEPNHFFNSIKANYDIGAYGSTNLLPFTLSMDYGLRGIADEDWFYNEIEDSTDQYPYQAKIQNVNLKLSLKKGKSKRQLGLHLLGGATRYDIKLQAGTYQIKYTLTKGYRAGTMTTFIRPKSEAKRNISPCGIAAKLQYDFWRQYSLKEENNITYENGTPKFHYDNYLYHQVMGHTKMGIPSPWYNRHDIHLDLQGTLLKVAKEDKPLPSHLLPGAWIPGYTYYYKYNSQKTLGDGTISTIKKDTLLVTGKAVLRGELSYRFPLWPKLIDKKIGFLYLERLYGAFNFNGGAGFNKPSDILKFNKADWLCSYGTEVRLEAKTFNSLPLGLKLRWDNGFQDKKWPRVVADPADINKKDDLIGGSRFTIEIGFDFDGWSNLTMPDYMSNIFNRSPYAN